MLSRWRLKWWYSGLLGVAIGLAIYLCQRNYPRVHSIQWSERSFLQQCQNWQTHQPVPFKNLAIVPRFDGNYAVSCLYFSYPDYKKAEFEIAPDSDGFIPSMRTYASRYFWLRYEYQWWREPRLLIWAYPIIGAFLLGIVIPFLKFLWTGGSTLPDSNRFAETPADATPTSTEMTIEQSQELDAAIGAAQQASTVPPGSGAISAAAPREAPIRKLDSKPLAEPPPATAHASKDFHGEYYPTEIHHDDPDKRSQNSASQAHEEDHSRPQPGK